MDPLFGVPSGVLYAHAIVSVSRFPSYQTNEKKIKNRRDVKGKREKSLEAQAQKQWRRDDPGYFLPRKGELV